MRKKGRGQVKRKPVKKKCTSPVCPFWVFVLFISAWFVVAALFVVFFYWAVRKPVQQLIPIAETNGGSTAMGVEIIPDEVVDPQPQEQKEEQPVLEIDQPSVTIESCRPLEETDWEAESIRDLVTGWGGELRQLGDRCQLSTGQSVITFTSNILVHGTTRYFLNHTMATFMKDDRLPNYESFYCRTSPRGEPAKILQEDGDLVLECAFNEGAKIIRRYLHYSITSYDESAVVNSSGIKTYNDPRNYIDEKRGTGDYSREFCTDLPIDNSPHETADICKFRNGSFAGFSSSSGDFYQKESKESEYSHKPYTIEIRGDDGSCHGPGFVVDIIGSEGSNIDILCSYHYKGEDGNAHLDRMNIRTGEITQLYDDFYTWD